MSVKGFITITMIDHDVISISISLIARNPYYSVCCCIDRGSLWSSEIKTRMKLYCFINRIDTITKAGGYSFKIGVA